jgi:hypothetical protein
MGARGERLLAAPPNTTRDDMMPTRQDRVPRWPSPHQGPSHAGDENEPFLRDPVQPQPLPWATHANTVTLGSDCVPGRARENTGSGH